MCTRAVRGAGVGGDSPGQWPCRWYARVAQGPCVGELEPELYFLAVSGQFHDWSKERKIDYVDAEHAPEDRLVAPNP